jgi:hypothetical protein
MCSITIVNLDKTVSLYRFGTPQLTYLVVHIYDKPTQTLRVSPCRALAFVIKPCMLIEPYIFAVTEPSK